MVRIREDGTVNFESTEWLDMDFGKALRELRRNEELTMNDLAKKSGVSQSYISQLENGIRLPSDKILEELSLALAKGWSRELIDFFNDSNIEGKKNITDHYTDEFTIETRQQDFSDLLKKIKKQNESRNLQNEYLQKATDLESNLVIEISAKETQLLKKIRLLDDTQKITVLSFIDFLISK